MNELVLGVSVRGSRPETPAPPGAEVPPTFTLHTQVHLELERPGSRGNSASHCVFFGEWPHILGLGFLTKQLKRIYSHLHQKMVRTKWNNICKTAAHFGKPSMNAFSLLRTLVVITARHSSLDVLFGAYCVPTPCAGCGRKETGGNCLLAKCIVFFQACSPGNKITRQYLGRYNNTF